MALDGRHLDVPVEEAEVAKRPGNQLGEVAPSTPQEQSVEQREACSERAAEEPAVESQSEQCEDVARLESLWELVG